MVGAASASPFASVTTSGDDSTNYIGVVPVIDMATNKVITTVKVGIMPAGVAATPDGTKIYVANSGLGSTTLCN